MKTWKKLTLTGIIFCFLITLFPPFAGGKSGGEEKFIGFHFLFATPKYKSSNEQVRRSYQHINGEKKLIDEKHYYPKHEYLHSRIDPVRYILLIILIALPITFIGLVKSQPAAPGVRDELD